MFEHLAAGRFDWRRVHIFWVDERCVPPDHADSNYRMVREALLDPTGIGAGQIHRIEGELQPEEASGRYEAAIREFFQLEGRETSPRSMSFISAWAPTVIQLVYFREVRSLTRKPALPPRLTLPRARAIG